MSLHFNAPYPCWRCPKECDVDRIVWVFNTEDCPLHVKIVDPTLEELQVCDKEYVPNATTCFYDEITTCRTLDGAVVSWPTTVATTIPLEPTITVELVCNTTTGFYDEITKIILCDGTVDSETIVATTITCDNVTYDAELVCNEITNLYDQIVKTIDADGIVINETITPTAIECDLEVTADAEYICNTDTGLLDLVINLLDSEDGSLLSSSTTATTIVCVLPTYDVELVCNADTGFYDQIVTTLDPDGLVTNETITPTTIKCVPNNCTISFVCNDVTGFYDEITICVDKDGNKISETVVPTTRVCVDYDYEYTNFQYCNPDTDTLWLKTSKFVTNTSNPNEPTVEQVISDVDTGVPCGQVPPTVDYEEIKYCNPATDTLWIKWYQVVTTYDSNGQPILWTPTLLLDEDTALACGCQLLDSVGTITDWTSIK